MPALGYSAMFSRMSNNPRISFVLGTDYREITVESQHTVYTGPIDEFFGYVHGVLPYRSLRFEFESFSAEQLVSRESISGKKGFWQPTFLVSYPNSEEYTRTVEIKHVTGQQCDNTTVVKDYPEDYAIGKEAYYPIPAPDSEAAYTKYKEMTAMCPKVSFVGRLATYKYWNMDQVVGMSLSEFERLRSIL
jgi:UDP-galactopyranose mutase